MSRSYHTLAFSVAFALALFSFFPNVVAYTVDYVGNFSIPYNGNITVKGNILNDTPESITGSNWVINVSLANNNFAHGTTSYGAASSAVNATFNVSVNASGTWGSSFLTMRISNGTFNLTRALKFRVTNTSTATIEFVGSVPPFSPGGFITTKITAKNWSGGNQWNQTINGTIFVADGPFTGWGVNSSRTNENGETLMNFSIPSNADAIDYILSVEGKAGFIFFGVARYTLTVATKDNTGANKNAFAPGSAVTIESRLTYTNGTPVSSSATKVELTDPNELVTTSSGSSYSDGRFQYNYTASVSGTYKIKVISGEQETSGSFSTRTLTASIVNRETASFFREFAGKKLFPPGENVSLTIVPTNVSSGEVLASGPLYNCNVTSFHLMDVYFANNQTSINSTVLAGNLTYTPTVHTGTPVCGMELKLTQNYVGLFGIKLNVSADDNTNAVAQGYFNIQKNGLSVEPSSEFGEGGFQAMLLPGSNTSFKLTAFNITSGENMQGGNVTYAWVKKITIMSLTGGGSSEISGLESNFTFVSAAQSDDGTPYLSGGPIPTAAGPQMLTVMATVAGETNITADAFYLGKYLMGFGTPSGTRFEGGEGEGGGGHEGGRGGGMSIDCSGTTEFNVMVFDAKTFMPASSVSFLSILSAQDELTGSDVSSCLTVTKGLTDSTGQAKINVTFSGSCTYSGFHFMLFNVSFQDKTDQVPAGFSCESMSMTPSTYNSLNQQRFSFSPTSNITILIQNPSYTANSSRMIVGGNMSVAALINMNPSTGATVLTAINPIIVNISNSTGQANGTITINPMHFMSAGKPLTKWPNGFFELRIKVCDNASTATKGYSGSCGTSSNSGFKVAAFDMWTDWWMNPSNQAATYQPGGWINGTGLFADLPPLSYPINITRIVIELMDFESGKKYNATRVEWINGTPAYNLLSNIENVSFNFSLPATLKAGDYGGIITATNSFGGSATPETSEDFIFLSVKGLTVGMAPIEQWSAPSGRCQPAFFYHQNWITGQHAATGTTDGWSLANWTFINSTYLGIIEPQVGFSTLVCTGPTLGTTNDRNQPSTNYTKLNVMVVANDTHSFVFLGNRTGVGDVATNVIRMNITGIVPAPGYKTYLWTIDGAPFVRFVNVTTLSTSGQGGQGTVSSNFAFGGSHRIREQIWLPMVAFRGSDSQTSTATRLASHWFNITEVAEMNTEGFGIKSKLPQFPYDFNNTPSNTQNGTGNWTDFIGNATNADGLVFIPLNVTKSGRFMAFWKVNSTPAEKSTFKNSINFNVRSFNTQGTFVQLVPNTTRRIVLKANITTFGATVGANDSAGFPDSASPVLFFNGSFTETASDQLVRDGVLSMFRFVVTNATTHGLTTASATNYTRGNLTILYMDDDPVFSNSGQCAASAGARSQATNELSSGCGAGLSGVAFNYPTMSVSAADANKALSFGSFITLGLTDWYMNNTHVILNFYESSPSIPWATVSSTTQPHGIRVCASTFSNQAKNATFALKYNNWMQGMLSSSQTANITVYNLTHGGAVNLPNETSASIYDGCLLTEILPQSGSWSAGRNEVVGTATELDTSGASTGVQEEMFAGPVEFLSGGRKTF
ncbi:MAG: hypothetical protein HY516_01215 [Candidatus Aenigmarchaeota archaeon]|nr:hypothetical protein [Candidatus Aenigmarchaeota archaeon]